MTVRRLIVLLVLGLLLGAVLVNQLEQQPGYVYISLGDVVLETTVWFAVFIWLLTWGLLVLALSLLRRLWGTHRAVSGWLGQRKSRNATALTNRGLINFIEGNWARARKQLLRSARYSEAPLINHLIAARASFRLGDIEEAKHQLGTAESVEAEAGIAVELTQAELQLSGGNYEQALATLVRARSNAAKHPYVLALLARAHRQLGDWQALRPLLPELHKYGLLEDAGLRGLEGELWEALVVSVAGQSDATVADLESLWRDIPLAQRELVTLRRVFLQALSDMGAQDELQRHLVAWLAKQWQVELLDFLGRSPPTNPRKLLKTMKKWLDTHGEDPLLLLAAARVALYAKEWDAAQQWLETAYERDASAEICCELARFIDARGEQARAAELRAEAAALSVGPLPELPLPNSLSEE